MVHHAPYYVMIFHYDFGIGPAPFSGTDTKVAEVNLGDNVQVTFSSTVCPSFPPLLVSGRCFANTNSMWPRKSSQQVRLQEQRKREECLTMTARG